MLVNLMIRSFEKFKPDDISINYIIVENSSDITYKDRILSLADSITWVSNPTALVNSAANAIGIEVGLKYASSEYVFMSHCDTFVTNKSLIPSLVHKVDEGFELVGTVLDPCRINAVHQSGMLVSADLARSVNLYPIHSNGQMTHDVCDTITQRCRDENIKHTCFRNTFNSPELVDIVKNPFKAFHVDRSIDDSDNVMFMHLGRGIPKQFNQYKKPNRVYFPQWVEFCNKILEKHSE